VARRTATTANAILGLLSLRPEWSTWEITKQLRRNMRFFWPRAESQIYTEAKALVSRGHARDRRAFTGRRPRTSYSITPAGQKEFKSWLESPPNPTALECEPLLRIFFADFSTLTQLKRALSQLRDDARQILEVGRVVGVEYQAGTAPFQDQVHVRALIFDFLSHHAMMLLEWADRAEEAIDTWPDLDTDARDMRARATIATVLESFPLVTTGPEPE
jgi:DNA-binding PadR family transcriptional regulator